ncbi:hypothetical protein AJ80_06960 [Polytolypa hystricis UAMH7299]|uniref:Mitochondrial thiamine pyrophosphate carrier 1 n=1 Tax=Polytolypa hystricis (strain UAMH7299) TaxID=1447883 RepID=A0A2B7XT29_POLH7|nr:hypothetical protein AJ80_06960 [Polytolypa hystricis UAMH7299]
MAATTQQITIPLDHEMPVVELADRRTVQNHGLAAAKDFAFGSVAGIAGKFIEYPFDTVKVRLQAQPDNLPLRYQGPIDCFRQSLHAGGFRGLYRGISPPLVGAAIENSCLFFSYRVAQDVFRATLFPGVQELPFGALLVAAAASGSFTSLLLTPVELIKCKMQVPVEGIKPPGPLKLIAQVFRHHGIAGFWRGQMGTLIRETGGSAAWFGSYECVSAYFRSRNPLAPLAPTHGLHDSPHEPPPLPVHQQMLAGAAAGVSYNFIFFPADTIKSRIQTEDLSAIRGASQRTFWTVGKSLWQQQGIAGLYRGCGITVVRSAPSSAFIFAIYEGLRHYFK